VISTVGGPAPRFLVAVERELRAVDPTAAIENPKTLEQIRDDSLASRTFAMQTARWVRGCGQRADAGRNLRRTFRFRWPPGDGELAIRSAVGAAQKDIRKLDLRRGISIDCERGYLRV